MLSTSKTSQNLKPVVVTVAVTLAIWMGSKWYYNDWFDNPYKYPAKAASLSASVLFCWCLMLSTRNRTLENYFGGLDKVYQIHKRLGKADFRLILLHPLFLTLDRFPDLSAFLQRLWFIVPHGDRYLTGHNIGIAALLFMIALLVPTLWLKIPYHRWKRTHEWFGAFLVLLVVHIVIVNRDWKSPAVALFYLVPTQDKASFDNDIRNEVILSHFHGFPAFEERGHHYELYEDVRQGFITADYIESRVHGGVRDKYIFLCGPSPMVSGLIRQFRKAGIRDDQIIVEDFNLV